MYVTSLVISGRVILMTVIIYLVYMVEILHMTELMTDLLHVMSVVKFLL
jgi:hypothetical protein